MKAEYVLIKNIGKVITGKTPSTDNEANFGYDYPFITPTDIKTFSEKRLLSTERNISVAGAKILRGNMLPAGSICFVCIGSTIGKMCLTNQDSFTNQQINSVIVNMSYDSDYIFYLLRYVKGYFQQLGAGTGSGKGIVNKSTFEKTKIPVIENKMIQQRIGEILSNYDELIEKNNRKIAILQEQAQEIYKEWFVRFRFPGHETARFENGLPEGWRKGRFDEVCIFSRGKNITAEDMQAGSIPVISAGIDPSGFHNAANVNGVSITISSSGANAGYISLHYSDIWAADCSYVSNTNNIYYVYELLNNIRPYVFNLQRGAAQPHVYPKDVNRIKIIIPEEGLQVQFNAIAEKIHSAIAKLMKINDMLITSRDLLLPRLMSGKLEVK